VLLVNARQVKNVPGRKTDVSDAAWLAQLGAHGLVRGSFVPPEPIRRLRDLTRTRTAITRERTREWQRMEKLLEDAGIKLTSVATVISGPSGRDMLDAMIDGERNPAVLADLARARLRDKIPALTEALEGRFTAHHAFLTRLHLNLIDSCTATIAELTARIEVVIEPFRRARDLIATTPGIATLVADVVVAETGADMTRFPTAAHLASWTGTTPGSHESAGRVKSTKTRPGNPYLKGALGIAALSIARSGQPTRLSARYRRIAARRGPSKALVAMEHTVIVSIWHMLTADVGYADLGADYYTRRNPDSTKNRAVKAPRTRLPRHPRPTPRHGLNRAKGSHPQVSQPSGVRSPSGVAPVAAGSSVTFDGSGAGAGAGCAGPLAAPAPPSATGSTPPDTG